MKQEIPINVSEVRASAYAAWQSKHRFHFDLLHFADQNVPYTLVIIGVAIFLLSAPHTIAMFNLVIPGMGNVAPFLLEFGLIYTAFDRMYRDLKERPSRRLTLFLEIVLFTASVTVNLAGSLQAAIQGAGLTTQSAGDILKALGTLPIVAQIALFLAVLDAVLIPLAAIMVGAGIAELPALSGRKESALANLWRNEGPNVLYVAFYDAIISQVGDARIAKAMANNLSNAEFSRVKTAEMPKVPETPGVVPAKSANSKGDAKRLLDGLYASNSELVQYKADRIMEILKAQGTPVGKSAVYDWLKTTREELTWIDQTK